MFKLIKQTFISIMMFDIHIVPFFNYKVLNRGIQGKYMNKKTLSSFYSYKFLNMDTQEKYVSCYSHSSFKTVKIN